MTVSNIIESVRLALRITTDAFDQEIEELIGAALLDLWVAGVINNDTNDMLMRRAIITYVRMHFGQPDDYDRLKASYDEQKAQLATCTGYTRWEGGDGQV